MSIIRLAPLLVACLCLSAIPASAGLALTTKDAPETQGEPEVGLTTIAMTQSIVVPLADGDDLIAKQSEALRSFYQLVAGTCAAVRETIADTCEITAITFNTRLNDVQRPDQPKTIRIDGTIQTLVRLKTQVGPPTPENSKRRRGPLY